MSAVSCRAMRDLRSVAVLSLCLSASALAEPPAEDPCPLTEAKVTEVTGMKVTKKELRPWTFGVTQCVYLMASGTLQFQRVVPEAKNVKTEAELAAKLAETEKRRLLKDFTVPAYSFTGGVTVVLPTGVWEVLAIRGPGVVSTR
jgi:hypothetical protein